MRPRLSSSPFRADPEPEIEPFAVGDRVTHDKYGLGRVIAEEPSAVVVDFASQQVRVVSPFAKLTKL
ncbi:MAG: hypothetical protein ACRDPR_15140 [Nocardioidaceae bacterium]